MTNACISGSYEVVRWLVEDCPVDRVTKLTAHKQIDVSEYTNSLDVCVIQYL